MSKKQIIIDGVDVKDCKRRIGKDKYCRYYKRPCSENNFNCIWKKYLRKEQECEELKKDEKSLLNVIDDLQKTKNEWQEKYNDLGQDFDQLKRKEQELEEICKAFDIEYAIDEETGDLFGRCNKLYKKEQECGELKRVKDDFFKHAEISHEAVLNKNKIIDEQEKQLDQLKVENEELKKELQAQRDFTAHEQKLIYCVAYDKTCETGNECKQKKCAFKDRLKFKQALDEIRQYRVCEINDVDGEEDDVILGIIDEVMEP